jgi:protein TonB
MGCSLALHGLLVLIVGSSTSPPKALTLPSVLKATLIEAPSGEQGSSSAGPAPGRDLSHDPQAKTGQSAAISTTAKKGRRDQAPPQAPPLDARPERPVRPGGPLPAPAADRPEETGAAGKSAARQEATAGSTSLGAVSPLQGSGSLEGSGDGGHGRGEGGSGIADRPGGAKGAGGFDASLLAAFTSEIRRRIEENRSYPVWARKNNVQGVAVVRFTLTPNGRIRDIDLARSSGSPLLDEAAKEAVLRGEPYPSFPSWLTASHLALTQPIRFSLEASSDRSP